MREVWSYKKLGDLCDVLNGLWIGKKEPFINVAVIRNTNFTKDCKLNLEDVANLDVELKQFSKRKLQKGDIIIEKSGGSEKQPVGRPILFNISEGNFSFSNFTATLRLHDSFVLPEFLYICLYSHYRNGETLKMQSKTTGLHNLDMKAYLRLDIPYISIPEQQAIVNEIDLLCSIIEKQKSQLKDLDTLAQSIFYEMFGDPITNEKGWEVKKWNQLFDTKLGKMLDKAKQNSEARIYPYLANFNIQWGSFDLSDLRQMPFTDNEIEKYKLKKGDLMICEGGESGRCAIWPGSDSIILFQKAVHRARIKGNSAVDIMYIKFFMEYAKKGGGLKDYISKSTIEHLTGEKLNMVPIPLPPLSLQHQFAERVEAIERLKQQVQIAIKDLETLLASRMQYWFD